MPNPCIANITRSITSVTGLDRVTNKDYHLVPRFIWLVLVLSGVGFLCYHTQDRIGYFLANPVMVSMDIDREETLEFPAITFCNSNPLRYRLEPASPKHATDPEILNAMIESEEGHAPQKPSSELPEDFSWEEFIERNSHQAEDMIVSCTFAGEPCGAHNFSHIHSGLSLCYTFNKKGLLKARDAGIKNGLVLVLNSESHQHLPNKTETGFQIAIHGFEYDALMETDAFYVGPGLSYDVVLSRRVIVNLPAPYGECGEIPLRYYGPYNPSSCDKECETNYTISNCGCRMPYMPGSAKVCDPFTADYGKCQKMLQTDEIKCHCPEPCEEEFYDRSMNNMLLPKAEGVEYQRHLHAEDHWEENIVRVNMFFEHELSITRIVKEPAYSILALLSDIGGAMGLALGCCLLSFAEVVEFVILMCTHSCRREQHKSRDDNNVKKDADILLGEHDDRMVGYNTDITTTV